MMPWLDVSKQWQNGDLFWTFFQHIRWNVGRSDVIKVFCVFILYEILWNDFLDLLAKNKTFFDSFHKIFILNENSFQTYIYEINIEYDIIHVKMALYIGGDSSKCFDTWSDMYIDFEVSLDSWRQFVNHTSWKMQSQLPSGKLNS